MRKTAAAVLLLLVVLILPWPALSLVATAQGSVPVVLSDEAILTDEMGEYPLSLRLEILEDPSGRLTIEDVATPQHAAQFVPNQEEVPNQGLTKAAFWARFRVRNEARDTGTW